MQVFKNLFPVLLTVLIVLCFSQCEKTEEPEIEMEEMEEFVGHEGKYLGGWTSTTQTTSFTDYPISAIFRYSNGTQTKMNGDFFATGSFKSCCDLDDDGTMNFDIVNDSIKTFLFKDEIVDCEGNFSGSGVIAANGKLTIDFTGNDCDGNHVGTIVFHQQ